MGLHHPPFLPTLALFLVAPMAEAAVAGHPRSDLRPQPSDSHPRLLDPLPSCLSVLGFLMAVVGPAKVAPRGRTLRLRPHPPAGSSP